MKESEPFKRAAGIPPVNRGGGEDAGKCADSSATKTCNSHQFFRG